MKPTPSHSEQHDHEEPIAMTYRIDRIEGRVMPVNAFLVHGPEGLVLVDGMLTVSDAALVRQAVEDASAPLAAVVLTHPHPDHYAALWHIVGDADVPIVATRSVDEVIRRDDALKNEIVGPMMGAEWPTTRLYPTRVLEGAGHLELGGLSLEVEELGPGESSLDTLWWLDREVAFAGDIAYNGMHAYLADGHWEQWLATLDRLEGTLPANVTLHVGHGPAGGKELFGRQRRYIEAFVAAVSDNADAIGAGDHSAVVTAMKTVLPTDDLLFLMELSIEPVHGALTGRP
jgi:glyoxylase-like metal-dependent hydrolase (beta-lactamase superfamily II)